MMNHFFLTATIHFQLLLGRLCGIVWSSAISVQWITQFDDTYMADTDKDYHFMAVDMTIFFCSYWIRYMLCLCFSTFYIPSEKHLNQFDLEYCMNGMKIGMLLNLLTMNDTTVLFYNHLIVMYKTYTCLHIVFLMFLLITLKSCTRV